MILLDTDIVTLFNRGHSRILAHAQAAPEVVSITIVSRIEILRGDGISCSRPPMVDNCNAPNSYLREAEQTLHGFPTVFIDAPAAAEFDRLRQDKKLKKIGRADLLIAAIALANRATLVSRNLRDFQKVPGLHVENWADD